MEAKLELKITLTDQERTELKYLKYKGFNYLARNEIGSVNVYVNKPHRDKEVNYKPFGKDRGGYDHWIKNKTPLSLEERMRTKGVEFGSYDFIKWEHEPMLIDDLLKEENKGKEWLLDTLDNIYFYECKSDSPRTKVQLLEEIIKIVDEVDEKIDHAGRELLIETLYDMDDRQEISKDTCFDLVALVNDISTSSNEGE